MVPNGEVAIDPCYEASLTPIPSLRAVEHLFQVQSFNESFAQLSPVAGFLMAAFCRQSGTRCPLGANEMLVWCQEPLQTPLLAVPSKLTDKALHLAEAVRVFVGTPTAVPPPHSAAAVVHDMLRAVRNQPHLRHELFLHLIRATRGIGCRVCAPRAWELFALVACALRPPPAVRPLVLEHAGASASAPSLEGAVGELIQKLAMTVERLSSAEAPDRRTVPTLQELAAAVKRDVLTVRVFFVDGTFENVVYGIDTTVREAVAQLAYAIGLKDTATFSLFACTPDYLLSGPNLEAPVCLDDAWYVGDVLRADLSRQGVPGEVQRLGTGARCGPAVRLLFRKRLVLQADATLGDPVFVALCYAQALQEVVHAGLLLMLGVDADLAAELCALQMHAEYDQQLAGQEALIFECIRMYIPSQLLAERSKEEWVSVVQRHYASIAHFSTADARREYFCALVGLPLAFCSLHRVVAAPTSDGALHLVSLDGQGQGPAAADEMLLGVNSTGVHLFRAATLRLVHSIPYRHIRQVASNLQGIRFDVMLDGRLQDALFNTAFGQAIHCEVQEHLDYIVASQHAVNGTSLATAPPPPPDIAFLPGCRMHAWNAFVDAGITPASSTFNSPHSCQDLAVVPSSMPSSCVGLLPPLSTATTPTAAEGALAEEEKTSEGAAPLDPEAMERERLARVTQLATVYNEFSAAVVAAKSADIDVAAESVSPEELAVISWKPEKDTFSSELETPPAPAPAAAAAARESSDLDGNDASAELAIATSNVASQLADAVSAAGIVRRADKWHCQEAGTRAAVLPAQEDAVEGSIEWRGLPAAGRVEGLCPAEGICKSADGVVHLYAPWQVPPGEGAPAHVAAVVVADLSERGGVRLKLSAALLAHDHLKDGGSGSTLSGESCNQAAPVAEAARFYEDVKASYKVALPSEEEQRIGSRRTDQSLSETESLEVCERQSTQRGDMEPARSGRLLVQPVSLQVAQSLSEQRSAHGQGTLDAAILASRSAQPLLRTASSVHSQHEPLRVETVPSSAMLCQESVHHDSSQGGSDETIGKLVELRGASGASCSKVQPAQMPALIHTAQQAAGVTIGQTGADTSPAQRQAAACSNPSSQLVKQAVIEASKLEANPNAAVVDRNGCLGDTADSSEGECRVSENVDTCSVASSPPPSSVTGAFAETAVIGDTEILDDWPSRDGSLRNPISLEATPELAFPRSALGSAGPSLSGSGALSEKLSVTAGHSVRLAASASLSTRPASSLSKSARGLDSTLSTPRRRRTRVLPGTCGASRATQVARMRRSLNPDFTNTPDDLGNGDHEAFSTSLAALCARDGGHSGQRETRSQSPSSRSSAACAGNGLGGHAAEDALAYLSDSTESASAAHSAVLHVDSTAPLVTNRKLPRIKTAPQPSAVPMHGDSSDSTSTPSPAGSAGSSLPDSLLCEGDNAFSGVNNGHDRARAGALAASGPFSVPPCGADESDRWVVRRSDSDVSNTDGDHDTGREQNAPSAEVMMAAAAAEAAALAAAARWKGKHASGMPAALPRLTPAEAKRQAKLKQASLGPKVGQHVKSFEREMRKLLRSRAANSASHAGDMSPAESDDSFL